MERVVESESKATEVEIEFEEEDDELEFIVPWVDEEMEDTSSGNRSSHTALILNANGKSIWCRNR